MPNQKNENQTTKVKENSGMFKKGHSKKGGRKKGTPNKKTADFISRLGSFDIVGEMLDLYENTEEDALKVQILKTLLEYQYPKRKAVDLSAEMEINREPFVIEFI